MNNLSWFLYFAELGGGLKNFFNGAGFVMCLATMAYLFGTILVLEERPKYLFRIGFAIAFAFFLSAIVPSRQTLYLIAASEAGEAVATSDDGREIINLMKNRIKKELKNSKDDE